jgi:hypothetical protein
LGDEEGDTGGDTFSLDEEEQDITTFGKRNNGNRTENAGGDHHTFSVSRGLTSLFSSSTRKTEKDTFDGRLDSSSSNEDSDDDTHPPLEARRSLERKPLDIDDDDEEMGEMVAPTEDGANSSDEEVLSPQEKQRLSSAFGTVSQTRSPDEMNSEFDGQGDEENEDDGEGLVEIAMPVSKGKGKRRSMGRG